MFPCVGKKMSLTWWYADRCADMRLSFYVRYSLLIVAIITLIAIIAIIRIINSISIITITTIIAIIKIMSITITTCIGTFT